MSFQSLLQQSKQYGCCTILKVVDWPIIAYINLIWTLLVSYFNGNINTTSPYSSVFFLLQLLLTLIYLYKNGHFMNEYYGEKLTVTLTVISSLRFPLTQSVLYTNDLWCHIRVYRWLYLHTRFVNWRIQLYTAWCQGTGNELCLRSKHFANNCHTTHLLKPWTCLKQYPLHYLGRTIFV